MERWCGKLYYWREIT